VLDIFNLFTKNIYIFLSFTEREREKKSKTFCFSCYLKFVKNKRKKGMKTSYLKPQPIYLRTKISPTAEEKRREPVSSLV